VRRSGGKIEEERLRVVRMLTDEFHALFFYEVVLPKAGSTFLQTLSAEIGFRVLREWKGAIRVVLDYSGIPVMAANLRVLPDEEIEALT
jgi:hypothetical protein